MTTEIRACARGSYDHCMPSEELAKVTADLRAEKRPGNSGSAENRGLLHPVKGWLMDGPERDPDSVNLQQKVRHPAHDRTRA